VLFLVAGLLSIFPTVTFLKWNRALKQGSVPTLPDALKRKLRLILHAEASLLLLVMLCAAMMAKGIGYAG
jgi:putative membrane protein